MKIGIDARMYGPKVGGIGNYVKNLIHALLELDKKNEYVLFFLEDGYKEFSHEKGIVKKVLVKSHWYSLSEQIRFMRRVEKEKTDIMHFPNFNVPLLFTRKFVTTIHDMTPWYYADGQSALYLHRRWGYTTVISSAVRRAESILSVSEYTKKDIVKLFPKCEEKIRVVYPGIDSFFHKEENYVIINEAKKRYGITKPYILYVGVFRVHKYIPALLRAFKIISDAHPEYELVLVGDQKKADPDIEKTMRELSLEGKVRKTGFIPNEDLNTLYSAAEVTVIPSLKEGFGLHALESLTCGTPVAASEMTSIPEILGDSGIYFNPNDEQETAKVIKRVLFSGAVREALLRNSESVLQKYAWDKTAQKTLEAYKQSL